MHDSTDLGRSIRALVAALACAFGPGSLGAPAAAATITVTSLADEYGLAPNGNCSVREAIDAANLDVSVDACAAGSGSDEVVLPAGTYTPTARTSLTIRAPAAIRGAGREVTTVEGWPFDPEAALVNAFDVSPGAGPVWFSDLTIARSFTGIKGDQGDVYPVHATRVRIRDNYFGVVAGTLVLDDVEVTDNGGGGALRVTRVEGQRVNLHDNRVRPFQSCCGSGGAISATEVSLVDSDVADNFAGSAGGGIAARRLTLLRTRLAQNESAWGGGAAAAWVDIRDSTITANEAGVGGGMAVGGGSIVNSSVSGNLGAVSTQLALGYDQYEPPPPASPTPLSLVNVTVFGDAHHGSTSLIAPFDPDERGHSMPSEVRFRNTVIAGGGCADPDHVGAFVSEGGNLESPGSSCGLGAASDRVDVTNPGLAPLRDDGRGGAVHPLVAGSPAIDGALAAGCPPADQTGFARPVDGDGDGSPACDRGAFEARPLPCTDVDGDGWGRPASAACVHPALDCDDANGAVNPGHKEVPGNGIDDDCKAFTSDCKDIDGDGYGRPASRECAKQQLDCDDQNARVNPSRREVPSNGRDDDCDSRTPARARP